MLLAAFMAVTSVGWVHAQTDPTDDGYIKTDSGYTVTTAVGLQNVLKAVSEATTITLANDLDISQLKVMGGNGEKGDFQGIFFLDKKVELTIDGQKHKIYGTNTIQGTTASNTGAAIDKYEGKTYVFYLQNSDSKVTFKDLTVGNTNIVGFNFFAMTNLVFENVNVFDNAEGGVHLNSSKLDATNINTRGNGKFAIKLSRETAKLPGLNMHGTYFFEETDVPVIAYFDRKAYQMSAAGDTPTPEEFKAMVTFDKEDTFTHTWWDADKATLHTEKNSLPVRAWTFQNKQSISKVATLQAMFGDDFATIHNIQLAAGEYVLDKQLVINRSVNIMGSEESGTPKTILKANANATWPKQPNNSDKLDNSKANLVTIVDGTAGSDVILSNLIIQGSMAAGINAQSPMTTKLNNVTLDGNATAGLLVHSAVEARSLYTKNNVWGGVNIDKGTPEYSPSFDFDYSVFTEQSKIWSEDTTTEPAQLVKAPADWTSYVGVQGTNSKEMRYWTNSKLTFEFYQQFPNKPASWNSGYTFIYANGQPITIEQGSTTDLVKISVDNTSDFLEVETSKHPVIFGGAKNATVKSSKITMKGGKIMNLFGGGYGESNGSTTAATAEPAGVTGSTVINVSGGEAHNIMGGGLYYSKSNTVNITISKVTMDANAWVLCGGLESGLTTAGKYPVFDKCTNTVNEGTLTITGGTFCYIGIGGTDGWGGYVKKATANISGTTSLVGIFGNGSNGASDDVIGTLTGCTFTNMGNDYPTEIASINRGHVKNVTLNFNKCTFPESVVAYIGGTTNWKKDYKSSGVEVVPPGTISFSFDKECTNIPTMGLSDGLENANVTVEGAPVKVASFNNGADAAKTAFTIAKDKTWNLNGGLTVDEGSSLTNNGTLNVAASSAEQLTAALAVKANRINLDAKDYTLTSNLKITNPIVLAGTVGADNKMTTLTQTTQVESAAEGDNLVTIESVKGDLVSLENIAITKSDNFGLHVFSSDSVKLTNVTLSGNKAGGLLVNGSTVTADKLTTKDNAWGGIEVGKGKDVTTDPKLIISNSTLNETSQIWADTDPSKEGSEKVAEWVAGAGWNMFVEQPSGKDYKQTFWSQKTKIQINVTKSTFFYDGEVKKVEYTVTPKEAKESVTVTYKTIAEEPQVVSADTLKSVGSYYVIFTCDANNDYLALNDTVTMSINAKGVPVVSAKPNYTAVEAGQPLSMSFLEGGKAVVSGNEVLGTFAWADANMVMEEGDNTCAVVFTPANLAEMEVAVDTITINAKRYFTVTTGVSANGKAVITNKSTSNRYPRNTKLNFAITPETGYEFTGWNDKTDHKETSYEVGQDTSFVAGFAKKKFTVTVTAPGNSNTLTVKYKDAEGKDQTVTSPATLDYGTVLTITATAADNYNAESITSTGSTLSKGQIFLDANTTISATFAAKPKDPQQVNVTTPVGGTVRLTNKADGKEIVAGSFVSQETKIIVERTPNKGYKLTDPAQARTEETVGNTTLTIASSFTQETYKITAKAGTGYTLSVDKTEGHYGDQVNVSYQVSAGYKAVALMVNAKEVPNNSTFTLTENTTVQAIVKEKATVAVDTKDQSYVYNSYNQAFVVKTTPAGLDSVSVSYVKNGTTVSTPIDAGTYTVRINRPEDENFKALNATATLEITKAPIVITGRPSDANGTNGAASVAGTWASGEKPNDVVQPMTKAASTTTPTYVIYTPTSNNYSVGYCALTGDSDPTITINQPTNGTVTVWEGSLQIENGEKAAKDVALTAIATPAEGYKFSAWTSGITTESDKSKASAEVTPSGDAITFAATFVKKADLTPSVTNVSATYDGTAKGGNLTISAGSVITGWSYSFQQNGIAVVPVNAGKYDVLVTRAADADNNACRELIRAAFEITKAKPNVTTNPVATVVKGAMLYSAEVTGGAASTDGTFVWKDADEAISANATKKMTFVPSDTENFESVEVADVSVTASDAQVISFVQPENGTITVKRGEIVLASGDPIADGDVLTISAQPASGYELSTLTVNGATKQEDGTYKVSGTAAVSVTATMKKKSTGGSTPDPEPVAVNSVSLDKTELTLPRTESYTLVATINPSDASDKSVTWKSSDESVAKVDANGKVTALKVGTATITVTTVDGAKTATCEVTVDFATGLEEALANTQVYAKQGSIYVNPIQPLQLTIVNMLGKTVYNARISSYAQIPVTNGIYIVKLTNAGNTIVTKVNVY